MVTTLELIKNETFVDHSIQNASGAVECAIVSSYYGNNPRAH